MSQKEISTEVLLQQILDCLPYAIFWKDRNSTFIGCNTHLLNLGGLNSINDIKGKNDFDMPWSDNAELYREDDRKVMESGVPKTGIIEELTQASEESVWLETNKIPLKNANGEVVGILGSFVDVTEKVVLQKENIQKEKTEVISQIAGSMAHDFKNSLSIITGLLTISQKELQKPNTDIRTLDFFNSKMEDATKKLVSLTDKFQVLSKENNSFTTLIDINEFFTENIDLLKVGKPINIQYKNSAPDTKIAFDEGMLFQVILNIVTNAIQADPKSTKIEIRTSVSTENQVQIQIKDFAGGIKKEILDKVFTPYFTTKSQGSGLGLASCKRIMEMHNSSIEVIVTEGVGSTFTLGIPVATKETSGNFIKFTKEIISGSGTIVFIDDESRLLEINKNLMEEIGYTVHCFENGEQAFANFAVLETADIIVTDFKFSAGEFDGEQILSRANELLPEIPVILLSGFTDKIGSSKKFDYALAKPLDLQKMSQIVHHFLQKKEKNLT